MQKIVVRFEKTLELSYPKNEAIKNPPKFVEGLINNFIMKAYETNPKGYTKMQHDEIFGEDVDKIYDAILSVENIGDVIPYDSFDPYDLIIKPSEEEDDFNEPFSWEWTVKLASSDIVCIEILPDRTFVIYGEDRQLHFYKAGEDVAIIMQEGVENILMEA